MLPALIMSTELSMCINFQVAQSIEIFTSADDSNESNDVSSISDNGVYQDHFPLTPPYESYPCQEQSIYGKTEFFVSLMDCSYFTSSLLRSPCSSRLSAGPLI